MLAFTVLLELISPDAVICPAAGLVTSVTVKSPKTVTGTVVLPLPIPIEVN